MTTPAASSVDGIDLSLNEFWGQPLEGRHADFAKLRALGKPPYFDVPEGPFSTPGDGYYAFVSHADVSAASRQPELFSSARGATSIEDLPAEFNEYFGSMINMDDPRHARLRRIVSRAFTPKMIKKFEEDVQRTAAGIVDDLLETGPCDFVQHVSARLPLKIICEMMGIGDEHYDMVLRNTNIILSGADPEFISENMDEAVTQLLTAGKDLADLVTEIAADRAEHPQRRRHHRARHRQHRRRAAHACRARLVLHPARRCRERDHQDGDLARAEPADRAPGPARTAAGRPRGPAARRGRGDRQVRLPRHLHAPLGDQGLHAERARLPRGRQGRAVLLGGEPGRVGVRRPGRFDITRSPNPHVGFGAAGPHFCLGAHLARREITVMLRELLTRVPQIRAAASPTGCCRASSMASSTCRVSLTERCRSRHLPRPLARAPAGGADMGRFRQPSPPPCWHRSQAADKSRQMQTVSTGCLRKNLLTSCDRCGTPCITRDPRSA